MKISARLRRLVASSLLVTGVAGMFPMIPASHAAAPTLYERMRTMTEREFLIGQNPIRPRVTDPGVAAFIAATYEPHEGEILPADVTIALSGDTSFCEPQPLQSGVFAYPPDVDEVPGGTRKRLGGITRCPQVRGQIGRLAGTEMQLRALGNDLMLIAAGQEQPVTGPDDITMQLVPRAQGLTGIWRAGLPESGLRLRTEPIPERGGIEASMQELTTALFTLESADGNRERLIAAVNRYRLGGYRFVDGQRLHEFPAPPQAQTGEGPGTPGQHVYERWPGVEMALSHIWMELSGTVIPDPPLAPGDVLLFSIPEGYQELLPGNVRLWAYLEQTKDNELSGDVGLTWVLPEPTLPSLCVNTGAGCQPILPGRYPPSPQDGTALCTSPAARRGYLCRNIESDGATCKQIVEAEDGVIILAGCTAPGEIREMESGPDSCDRIEWREDAEFGSLPTEASAEAGAVCDPNVTTEYLNTIGNNACYFNTCLKEQTNNGGFLPRDSGGTAQAGTQPTVSCVQPDPLLGSLDIAQSFRPWMPPPYRQRLVMKQLQIALCAGMGMASLPGLCAFPIQQGLGQPQDGLAGAPGSAIGQNDERGQAVIDIRNGTDALGTRIGTRLLTDYLSQRSSVLAGVINRATALLKEFTHVRFPQEMCPFNDADGAQLLQTDQCTPP